MTSTPPRVFYRRTPAGWVRTAALRHTDRGYAPIGAPPAAGTGAPPAQTPTDGLPFEVPAGLSSLGGRVFAHVINPYKVSIDDSANPGDYWDRNFLQGVPGEGGLHTPYGGMTRDRPLIRPPRGGDWTLADARDDVRWAVEGGIDGFAVDVLSVSTASTSSTAWYRKIIEAANLEEPGFKVVPQVDPGGSIGSAAVADITARIAEYAYVAPVRGQTTGNTWLQSAYRLDNGDFVLAAWRPELKTASWWQTIIDDLEAQYGMSVVFQPTFLTWSQSANYLSLPTVAEGHWGDGADPQIALTFSDKAGTARSRGHEYWAPVWAGDFRPYANPVPDGSADESHGTEAWRNYWARAISDTADHILLATWTDYREGCALRPGVKAGRSWLDIGLYWLIKYKTGSFPAVLRDAVYLSHRDQFITTAQRPALSAFRSGQTRRMEHWTARNGERAPADEVEVLLFLTAAATVTVNVGVNQHVVNAPAGVSAHYVPLAFGAVSAQVVRGGATVAAVTSPATVIAAPYHDDWGVYVSSSLRPPVEQGQFHLSPYLPST